MRSHGRAVVTGTILVTRTGDGAVAVGWPTRNRHVDGIDERNAALNEPGVGDEPTFQIGEVAERIGFSQRTIRHYDELGIVKPSGRSAGGFRLYTEADIQRFLLIKPLKPLGMGLEVVRGLLDTLDRIAVGADPADLDRLGAFVEALQARCDELRADLAAGEATARRLHGEILRRRSVTA